MTPGSSSRRRSHRPPRPMLTTSPLTCCCVSTGRVPSRSRCGSKAFPAAPPLQPSAQLRRAAEAHAKDMVSHDYFEHEGHDGSTPAQRVAATGYRYRLVGENLASGPQSAAQAVAGWLASPGHCQNIMDARFSEFGVAFAANSSGTPRIYWVQEFAAPRIDRRPGAHALSFAHPGGSHGSVFGRNHLGTRRCGVPRQPLLAPAPLALRRRAGSAGLVRSALGAAADGRTRPRSTRKKPSSPRYPAVTCCGFWR